MKDSPENDIPKITHLDLTVLMMTAIESRAIKGVRVFSYTEETRNTVAKRVQEYLDSFPLNQTKE